MCGIYGVIGAAGELAPAMRAMRDALRHRGPDGEGLVHLKGAILGHLRLSIIDLTEAAAQPLWDSGRRVCITYNGEIYNYRELRQECLAAGLDLHSQSDTEVIAGQYLLHGERAFARLNGMFAFCLHDARTGESYLVRDPMGIKPLYYAETPAGLVFASELGALMRSGLVSSDVDRAALQAYLQLDYVPAPMALLRGVRKLREGHLLHADAKGGRTIRAYSPLAGPSPEQRRWDDPVAELSRILREVVKRQMIADVPVGVFLSGGLDSSIVAQMASEVAPSRIRTFSIGFEDASFDESRHFDAVARAIGSEHHTEVLSASAMLEIVPRIAEVLSEPVADGSIFPTYLLARFTRQSVKVALSGDGADELFAGYPTYRAARIADRLPMTAARRPLLAAANALLPVRHENFSFDFKVKKFLAGLHRDPILRNARWLGTFLPEDLPDLLEDFQPAPQHKLEAMLHEPAALAPRGNALEALLRTDQRFYLQDGVLVKVDRASMAHSLEVRVPMLDLELADFARSLGPEWKLRGRSFKAILKAHAARAPLPAAVVTRPKKGFGAPLAFWFRGPLRDLAGDVLAPARLARRGLLRPAYVTRLLEEHWSGRRDHRKAIFNLLLLTMWLDALDATPRFVG
ncbi:MAG TPA: asparagine synthase (glutamine-hydrolyzing) [Thermoanaerobaculia bacterium]|nr:asparagine synthase (glutamine-hydrolyzing) [Thermoanaerobaculia bacterium]